MAGVDDMGSDCRRGASQEEQGERKPTIAFPRSWIEPSAAEAEELETELRRELAPAHRLHGRDVRAIARREGRDDVLFASPTSDGPVFWVHLTWSVEKAPEWPWTVEHRNLADFLDRWLREDDKDAPDEDAG